MKLLKNISYTFSSNALSILVSIFIVLIIPKFIGVHEYGLWQLFIFYYGYVGVLHLGWADGLFLRRGGQTVKEINKESISAETLMFIVFNCLIGFCIELYGVFFASHDIFIILSLGFAVLIVNTRTWITMILQSIGDFKGYAINLSAQSIVYLLLIISILFFKLADYRFMIVAFLISQMVTSISGFYQLRGVLNYNSKLDFKDAFSELKLNIGSGFKLMIANFTAILIIGVIRFGIQQKWSISTFGKIALVLSIANFMMVFINAVSLVLFPTLRRTKQIPKVTYEGIRNILMPLLYLMMFIYFTIMLIIPQWLPKYAGALRYASILMPMMVYQGKFEILSNTFMKNFRMEAKLMTINIITLIISVVLTIVNAYILHNINYVVFSIAFVMGIRSIMSEVVLSRKIKVKFISELLFENIFIIGFMFFTWNYSIVISILGYLIVMVLYLLYKQKKIKDGMVTLKNLSLY